MKILIIILLYLFLVGFSYQSKSAEPIYLISSKDGFEIYGSEKELLLEFTHSNTDSLSLETLDYIYEVLNERSVNEINNKFLLTALRNNESFTPQNNCELWQ
jgi:hypothetical protein